jgi:Family of unknown function (DUF6353)
LEDTLNDFEKEIDKVKAKGDMIPDSGYSRAKHNQEVVVVCTKGSLDIVRLYAPAILVGGLAIGALTGSHLTLTRRNASLTAAYSAVQMSFDAYRDRVREEFGEEKELQIHHAAYLEKKTIDGKIEMVMLADPNKWSMYAKFFDEYNVNWKKDPDYNRMFIQCQQNYFNHLLKARGHVFLNEVYDQLGFDHTRAGAIVGWVIGEGDNYIDFGMFEAGNSQFVNGWERSIILDFNVDGVVYDKI